MKILLALLVIMSFLTLPVKAADLSPPPVPDSGREFMPDKTENFGDGVLQIIRDVLPMIRPDLLEASKICTVLVCGCVIVAIVQPFTGKAAVIETVGSLAIAQAFLRAGNAMIQLGIRTIGELSEYGKMLFPCMASALAAQGAAGAASGLYLGTIIFGTALGGLMNYILIPCIYLYLCSAVACAAVSEDSLKKIKDILKSIVVWILKTSLSLYTGYMAITGAVSGATDAAALKLTRSAISTFVPVVGSIMSDASEAVLVSAGLIKGSIGVYGVLAILAVFVKPFATIGTHYLTLKAAGVVCAAFSTKKMTELVSDFSSAMGLLLAVTGAMCLFLLISCVCIMKGAG